MGMPAGRPAQRVVPTTSPAAATRGSTARGMSRMASSSSSQSRSWMLNRRVREALLASVTWASPPVRCQASQVSMVPKASSPRSARARAPGTVSSSHASLVPEKYASRTSPVLFRNPSSCPACRSASHRDAVRRSCQTMALATGRPVARSQSTVVSRWLVMPTAATSEDVTPPGRAPGRRVALRGEDFPGSCSTQPGGKIGGILVYDGDRHPARSNTLARELVVPGRGEDDFHRQGGLLAVDDTIKSSLGPRWPQRSC